MATKRVVSVNELLSTTEAAIKLQKVSGSDWPNPRTVIRWCDRGLLAYQRIRRGKLLDRRIHPDSLDEVAAAIRKGILREPDTKRVQEAVERELEAVRMSLDGTTTSEQLQEV